MLAGVLSSLLSTAGRLNLLILQTFNVWVHSPGRSFADKAGGKGNLSDNIYAAAPWCQMSGQDALMISSVSEIYAMDVICLISKWDSFCVARRFWLPYHISNKSLTLAILRNILSSTSFLNPRSLSVLNVSYAGSSHTKSSVLAQADYLTMTSSDRISPMAFDCL
jgi:hypothetical protein